jgi:hypothetical protein
LFAEGKAISGVGDKVAREAPITRIAGELGSIAEIFLVRPTIEAFPAGGAEPWHADPHPSFKIADAVSQRLDPADDFVSQDDRIANVGKLAVRDVQIGSAHATGAYLHANLAGSGNRVWLFLEG